MQYKDKNYMKENILAVYFKHQDKYVNIPYYRYMGQEEFETLFQEGKLYFTNPMEWKKSVTGDKNENYLEDWFTEDNITSAYRLIKQHCIEYYKQYCTQQYIMSVFSNFVGAATLLQQMSFCYCIANKYADKKMTDEYHVKYKRNIIIRYKNDFYKKLAILPKGNFLPKGIYLYADVMPMVYVENFEEFIQKYICMPNGVYDMAKNTFDYGAFLKDINFAYEHETRIKLHMHTEDYNFQILSNEFYIDNFFVEDEKQIVNNSMQYIRDSGEKLNKAFEEVKNRIKTIGGKQCFELCLNEKSVNEIVETILLHKGITEDERRRVYNLAEERKIPVIELDFDKLFRTES